MPPDFTLERAAGWPALRVVGVDEAGRGPWAGPVVAGAVCFLTEAAARHADFAALDDSKKMTPPAREAAYQALMAAPDIACAHGMADVAEIDRLNILQATHLAMQRAVAALPAADYALVDGNRLPDLPIAARCFVKGDARALSIAAASVIAKVTRDKLMLELSAQYPDYGWQSNKGYGAPTHREGLRQYGLTPHHRMSFAPMRDMVDNN